MENEMKNYENLILELTNLEINFCDTLYEIKQGEKND